MPKTKSIFWYLLAPYFLIGLLFLLASSWYSYRILKRVYYEKTAASIEAHARLVSRLIQEPLALNRLGDVRAVSIRVGEALQNRITVIDTAGLVLVDSEVNPETMENHAYRPEFRKALSGKTGMSVRRSGTLNIDMMYVAVPIESGEKTIAAVRASTPVQLIVKDLLANYYRLDLLAGLVALVVLAVAFLLSRLISRSVRILQRGVEGYSHGLLGKKLRVPQIRELDRLAENLNTMADRIKDLLMTTESQKRELEGVFANMTEGLLAVDDDEKITRINRAAALMFGLPFQECAGKNVQEVFRNSDLIKFIRNILSGISPAEAQIRLAEPDERTLQAHGAAFRLPPPERPGALIVLTDVTRLARLETVRKDFVANVSHELKTPVTSIKGFVETLKEGGWKDKKNAPRFLDIIARHADRLDAIIDDLLDLSRLEQNAQAVPLKLADVLPPIKRAVSACAAQARSRRISIKIECPKTLRAEINAPLLEQAVKNLVDNAVKYSEGKTQIGVACAKAGKEIRIEVADQGPGIPKKHLPRIFERFYRVDPARSRGLGGTGLGLAIVRHIVQVHNGRVEVQSSVGKGSTFSIILPE
jgi:two-component system phosphate regulon sensor histidine kinase PhoR